MSGIAEQGLRRSRSTLSPGENALALTVPTGSLCNCEQLLNRRSGILNYVLVRDKNPADLKTKEKWHANNRTIVRGRTLSVADRRKRGACVTRGRIIMLIEEITTQASLDLLVRARLGRLACSQGAQPYVVPFYFAYKDGFLYSFTTVGQKIEWMRVNPLVCVEVDEVMSSQEWMSVIVFGRYEELQDTPEQQSERNFAWELLQQYAMWWEPAYTKTVLNGSVRPLAPVFYRIHASRITGHRAMVDPVFVAAPEKGFPGTKRLRNESFQFIQKLANWIRGV